MPRTVLRFSVPAAGAVLNSLRLEVPGAGAVLNGPWREVTWPVAVLNSPWLLAPGAPTLLAGSQLQVIRAVEHFLACCWRASATRCRLAASLWLGVATEPGCGFSR